MLELLWQKLSSRKEKLITERLNVLLRKNCDWSVAPHGPETWTTECRESNYLKNRELLTWRRMQKIRWTEVARMETV